jgi:hypothetical protein
LNGELAFHRDLKATTMQGEPMWGFYHPQAQEVLLSRAAACGAEVLRAATLERVVAGPKPKVTRSQSVEEPWNTRLVSWCSAVAVIPDCAPNSALPPAAARLPCC